MKAGLMPASSNKTRAQTLPEWDEKRLISSSVRSGWTALEIGSQNLLDLISREVPSDAKFIDKHTHWL